MLQESLDTATREESAAREGKGRSGGRFCGCEDGRRDAAGRREANDEKRSAIVFVPAGNLPVVIHHHAIRGTQTQASTFANGLSRVERIEDTLWFSHPVAGVGEFQYHFLALPASHYSKRAAAGLFQSVDGVADDLHEYLL